MQTGLGISRHASTGRFHIRSAAPIFSIFGSAARGDVAPLCRPLRLCKAILAADAMPPNACAIVVSPAPFLSATIYVALQCAPELKSGKLSLRQRKAAGSKSCNNEKI